MRNLKKILALVLALMMTLSLMATASAKDFTDADEIQYKEAVEVMTTLGVLDGYPNGAFGAKDSLVRAAAAKIVAYIMEGGFDKVEDKAAVLNNPFTDLGTASWLVASAKYLANEGMLLGYGDGRFGPNDPLTAAAYGKLVLLAAGIGTAKDYVGDATQSFETKVMVALKANGLLAGLNETITAKTVLNREQACQIALNAMNYTPTGTSYIVWEEKGSNTVYNAGTDVKLKVTTDPAEAALLVAQLSVGSGTYYFAPLAASDSLLATKFAWSYVEDSYDPYGRPAAQYTKGSANLYYTAEPVMTSNTVITAAELYATLGYNATVKAAGSIVVGLDLTTNANKFLANGSPVGSNYAVADLNKNIGANGVVTEIYNVTTNPASPEFIVVQVQPTLVKIGLPTKVAANATTGAHTDWATSNAGVTLIDYTTAVKAADVDNFVAESAPVKDAYVFVVKGEDGNWVVTDAEIVTGKMTAKNTKTGTYTIAGTDYAASAAVDADSVLTTAIVGYSSFTATVPFVVDNYGYVMGSLTAAPSEANYLYVVKDKGVAVSNLNGTTLSTTVTTKVVLADGTMKAITVATVDGAAATAGISSNVVPGLYTYEISATTGMYALTTASTGTGSVGSSIAPTAPTVASGVNGNAETSYVVVNWVAGTAADYDRNPSHNVYFKAADTTVITGYKNIDAKSSVTGSYVKNADDATLADLVFIYNASAPAASAQWLYYLGTYVQTGASTYAYDVIVNGVETTMTNAQITGGLSGAGLYSLSDGTATGVGTTSSAYSSGNAKYCASGKTYTLVNNGGLLYAKVSASTDASLTTTSAFVAPVADNVPVYIVTAATGAVTVATAADLATPVTGSVVTMTAAVGTTSIGCIWIVK